MPVTPRWLALSVVCFLGCAHVPGDWPSYGRDPGGTRFSPLDDIDRGNVARLKMAWTFHTGDVSSGRRGHKRSGFESTPIVVDGTLYVTTPFNRIFALDPKTGHPRWVFDPHVNLSLPYGDGLVNRGLATWLDPTRVKGHCRRRLYEATLDARLVAVDSATGKPCLDFGPGGEVSLTAVSGYQPGWYHMTSPPTVVGDVVIVGSSIDDNVRAQMPSGVVRGFDARTGALRWSWDPIPFELEEKSGAANAWSILAADPARGLVFVPTGSASPDFYGGNRPGDDRWANSIVALRAATGKLVWGFQLVHHDLWDYDSASPPLVTTLGDRPVVAIGNKSGYLYVLDELTGAPIFPVREQPEAASDVPGESAWPTQPIPDTPPPLAPQSLTRHDLWGATPQDRLACEDRFDQLRAGSFFVPPSLQGSLDYPGHIGGLNWSGTAYDPGRGMLFVPTVSVPFLVRLIPRAELAAFLKKKPPGDVTAQEGTPYAVYRAPLLAPSGLPCNPPPWGQLAAVDLAAGTVRWQVPVGSLAGQAGSPILGGPIATAGGLVFIAGTEDAKLHAFDSDSGQELWSGSLPASGHATPITYEAGGKQYVVVAAGGHAKLEGERIGDAVVAFTLP
ncbi:MAG TPA: pyrroloquinoline quinone-dependent dehydrogenase [Myxococcales bacterium]|nr:pyrroloquinoline quinone-dependent dehydrogenase [Myxococcales bacterium]